MKMKNINILISALFILVLSSCNGFSKIEIGDVREISIKGFKDNALLVSLKLPIDNPSNYKITVLELDSKVFFAGMLQ